MERERGNRRRQLRSGREPRVPGGTDPPRPTPAAALAPPSKGKFILLAPPDNARGEGNLLELVLEGGPFGEGADEVGAIELRITEQHRPAQRPELRRSSRLACRYLLQFD